MAQAWSVAEIMRALVEDVHGLRPQAQPEVQVTQVKQSTRTPTAISSRPRMQTGTNP
jgi:glycogen debranching enzyme